MAVIDDTRVLGGVDVTVGEVGCTVKDATSLVAKAAATFGLPNLLHHARPSPFSNHVIWQTESCCSCTPLACMTRDNSTRGTLEDCVALPPSPIYSNATDQEVQSVHTGGKVISSFHGLNCKDRKDTTPTCNYSGDNEMVKLTERVFDEGSEKGETDSSLKGLSQSENGETVIALESEEERPHQTLGCVVPFMKTAAYRRRARVADYEKEWTFRPKLNHASLRLASQTGRSSQPVCHRLYEQRRQNNSRQLREDFTFSPKLNTTSLRLARERSEKLPEVHARMSQLAAQRMAEACADYTFHPHLSQRSLRIVQHMEADFQARQQRHLLRQQRKKEETQRLNSQQQYCRRSRPITLPSSSSTSPHNTPAQTHSHTHTSHSPSLPSNGRARLLYHRPSRSTHTSNSTTRRSPIKSPLKDSTPAERPKSTPSRRRCPHTTPPVTSPARRPPESSSLVPEGPWGQLSSTVRVKRVKLLAERAIKSKKVFVCRGGYRTIRRCLRERGWVEKEYEAARELASPYQAKTTVCRRRSGTTTERGHGRSHDTSHAHSDSSNDDSDDENVGGEEGEGGDMDEEEYHMLCRAVRNAEPNFVWTLRRDDSLYRNMLPSTTANHFAKASSFTTKVGLCTNLHSLMWCGQATSDLFFPRCYLLSSHEEKDTFIDDYHFTTALNILKLAIDQHWGEFKSPNNTYSNTPPNQNLSESPTRPPVNISTPCPPPKAPQRPVVPEEAIELALRACTAYVSFRQHDDIEEGRKHLQLTKKEWQTLVQHYYKIVLERGELVCSPQTVRRASDMLEESEKYLPQLHMNGVRNIWIVKPGAMSRGRGIVCLDRLEPILELVSSTVHKEGRWVVQKYIERPLLIYGTKFDIRQWFLVTDWNPLTMWMYKDCYLRFATQKFTLDNMNESVHLCNNSIQKNYMNSGSRSNLLPEENMWHSSTFRDYLHSLGEGRQWDQLIYPGMKHALTCAMQVSQDLVESRKNSFELYGADFMLTDDFKPWLIEINCSPTMESSTSVTSQLCTEVMEDTLKVVLDRREDRECSTGKFELAYKQPKFETPAYVGVQLCVEGVAIQQNHTHNHSSSIPVATLSYTNTRTS